MVETCTNPSCKQRFRYLREGKLFSFRKHSCSSQGTQYYWLCAKCAATLTLHFDPGSGVQVTPKKNSKDMNAPAARACIAVAWSSPIAIAADKSVAVNTDSSLLNAAEEATNACHRLKGR